MKRVAIAVILLTCLLFVIPASAAADNVTVTLDGKTLEFEVPPQMVNSRVLVPLRAIFEEVGADVDWDPDTETVTATKGGTVVVLTIGDNQPTVNGVVVTIDQPGILVDGRTLAPLRFVGEAFGGTVDWIDAEFVAVITFADGSLSDEPEAEDEAEEDLPYVQPIGIMSAMDSELALLLETADIDGSKMIGGIEYHYGKLEGKDVVLVRAGVGKSLASACTAVLIHEFDVSSVVFTGIAGGVGDDVGVLDVVIATDLILHDYGRVTADGFEWNGRAGVDRETGSIPVDKALSDLAYAAAVAVVGEEGTFRGTIVTGDQFIMSDPYVTELQEMFDALACEMEGASVARVAYAFDTPVVVIRCMSDKADGLAHEVIEDFGDQAADISASIVIEFLKSID
ncbi:MAG: 5'-methylthioadenosine/adenosylhomocysteine nucleosidase [Oscillospiraceae bacterium]|nr:5'-methylthioadenosine/adenosylhomocysteine nucleosidase [Oscillospiraceae bacterium]